MKTVPFITNPKLTDAVVITIASDLLALNWLDHVYCLAEQGIDDGDNTYPMIYLQDGTWDYIDIRPDDEVKAYCFFTDNGFDVGGDDELNQYRLSLYVWCRLDRIQANNQDFTNNLISDVLHILRDKECFGMTIDKKDPFAEFSALNYHDNSMLMRKRSGFRIDFSLWAENNLCNSGL